MRDYSNSENIHFEGFVNQSLLPTFYKLSSLVCLPSKQDSWGLCINEAIACGLVPIVSDSVGCASDLVETTSGLVFETGNSSDLALKIAQGLTLRTDTEVNEKIEEISSLFSMASAVQKLKVALKFN
jgi:glycosyltransferase involved in cell wall biosynthesis